MSDGQRVWPDKDPNIVNKTIKCHLWLRVKGGQEESGGVAPAPVCFGLAVTWFYISLLQIWKHKKRERGFKKKKNTGRWVLNSDAHFNIFGLLEHHISRQYVPHSLSPFPSKSSLGSQLSLPPRLLQTVCRESTVCTSSQSDGIKSALKAGERCGVCVGGGDFFLCTNVSVHPLLAGQEGLLLDALQQSVRVQNDRTKRNRRSKRREQNRDQPLTGSVLSFIHWALNGPLQGPVGEKKGTVCGIVPVSNNNKNNNVKKKKKNFIGLTSSKQGYKELYRTPKMK